MLRKRKHLLLLKLVGELSRKIYLSLFTYVT